MDLFVYELNFDFLVYDKLVLVKLFKLYGIIDKDVVDGYVGRIIIIDNDYDFISLYREGLYFWLKLDLFGVNLIIIGYFFVDEDIKVVVNYVVEIFG